MALIAASASPEILLEMQNFRLHPRLTNLQSRFTKISTVRRSTLIDSVAYAQLGKAGSQRVGTIPKLSVRRKQNLKLIYWSGINSGSGGLLKDSRPPSVYAIEELAQK